MELDLDGLLGNFDLKLVGSAKVKSNFGVHLFVVWKDKQGQFYWGRDSQFQWVTCGRVDHPDICKALDNLLADVVKAGGDVSTKKVSNLQRKLMGEHLAL